MEINGEALLNTIQITINQNEKFSMTRRFEKTARKTS